LGEGWDGDGNEGKQLGRSGVGVRVGFGRDERRRGWTKGAKKMQGIQGEEVGGKAAECYGWGEVGVREGAGVLSSNEASDVSGRVTGAGRPDAARSTHVTGTPQAVHVVLASGLEAAVWAQVQM